MMTTAGTGSSQTCVSEASRSARPLVLSLCFVSAVLLPPRDEFIQNSCFSFYGCGGGIISNVRRTRGGGEKVGLRHLGRFKRKWF